MYFEYYFKSSDAGSLIHVNKWVPDDGKVRGVLQIAHGIAEYGLRYKDFAEFMVENGFAVVANDHLGHGKTKSSAPLFFSSKDGWKKAVVDMEKLRRKTRAEFPGVPYFLLGHSMGSFLSRSHMIIYPGSFDGVILSGTGNPDRTMIKAGKALCSLCMKTTGPKNYSPLVDKTVFGSYNKKFQPQITSYDWLSKSRKNVEAYINDPLCGGKISVGLFNDLMTGLLLVTDENKLRGIDKAKPVFFISGSDDPVGDMGKGVKKAYKNMKDAGVRNLSLKLYPSLRHEILNEACKKDVYRDVLNWIEKHMA